MFVKQLNDLKSAEAAPYARLTEAQLRRAGEGRGLFIAESLKVISSALEAGYRPVSLLSGKDHIERIEAEIGSMLGETPVLTAPDEELGALTGYKLSRGVLCAMERKPLPSVGDVLKGASRAAVLEGVSDPTNVGAIIRSAAALGMDAVLVAANCCDPLHRRAARVSMGAVFKIPWAVLDCREDDRNSIDPAPLQKEGFKLCAAALEKNSICADDPRLNAEPRLAIVLGSEGNGLEKATIEACDETVMIPMAHGMDSLNVAAASAVLFWELAKRQ